MKFSDINARYTEIVTGYLANGYCINTATMSGSQGEIANIDLTNGSEIIRILVKDFSDWRENVEGIEIIIGKSTDDVEPNGNNRMRDTIWNSKLEVISTERFYSMDRWGGDYYGTEQEAKQASDLRAERYTNRKINANQYTPSPKAMEVAKKIARTKLGIKRICNDDLKLFKDSKGYLVTYRTKSYRLH